MCCQEAGGSELPELVQHVQSASADSVHVKPRHCRFASAIDFLFPSSEGKKQEELKNEIIGINSSEFERLHGERICQEQLQECDQSASKLTRSASRLTRADFLLANKSITSAMMETNIRVWMFEVSRSIAPRGLSARECLISVQMHIVPSAMTRSPRPLGRQHLSAECPLTAPPPKRRRSRSCRKFQDRNTWSGSVEQQSRTSRTTAAAFRRRAGRCGLSSICQLSHVVSRRQKGRRESRAREGAGGSGVARMG
ncbi:hypothetical protein KOW79_016589 [Hemibagrus wyckioides]|uniref:Uncharacterized protein n=1 Tax=Hemibagrus wyckioides TaxID=337641 RepID=A0A9D3SCI7_9TELE|nr:hypothetical protein KOW79_016589 [Hemibagrus wyckioides]